MGWLSAGSVLSGNVVRCGVDELFFAVFELSLCVGVAVAVSWQMSFGHSGTVRAGIAQSTCLDDKPFKLFGGVSGRLVGPAVFKAVEALLTQRLVGSIPIHSRGMPKQ